MCLKKPILTIPGWEHYCFVTNLEILSDERALLLLWKARSTQGKILLSFLNPLLISVACYGQIDMLNAAASILPGLNADPHRTVFGKKFYLYHTTDVFSGWKANSFSYWSSKDLINWKNEKVILDFPKDLNWEKEKAWAPAIASKNNKYYFYFVAEGKY